VTVTGFDVSATGLATAQRTARARVLTLTTVHAYDGDFDFGAARWDMIAMLYPMEKRSVRRIASALKPGGLVVVEVGRKDASGAPFEVESGELLRIFSGFRSSRYEETIGLADWSRKRIPSSG
jgi:SAM-dependent methyltransferase